jgi:cyclopropane-fatty-acyl-phospholipid synthase
MVSHGRLTIDDASGKEHHYGAAGAQPAVRVRIVDAHFPRKVLTKPNLAVGEAYMNGGVILEEGSLRDLLDVLLMSRDRTQSATLLNQALAWMKRIYRTKDVINPVKRAEKNVQHHYDIGDSLYRLFLDEDMQYSCAYWKDGVTTLEEAQFEKKKHIAKKLLLKPGMEVLDIGSGWGGMALHLAREHGVRVTGVTLSKEQFQTSTQRAKDQGLSDRVTFKLLDYRLETGIYDRIVSVGMFEHVGKPQFGEYFDHVMRLLKDDGVALIHTIAKNSGPAPIGPWIRKYIFPGAYVPALSELAPVLEKRRLWLTDLEVWRLHYAKTLAAWYDRFQAHRAEVAAMFDERFCRMWEFYLIVCEAGFRFQNMCNFQLQIAKRLDVVPLTRDYMNAEPVAAAAEKKRAPSRRPRAVAAE